MREMKTDIMLANTYHLMLQPGPDLIKKMGGLHKFTGWDGPMLTDSGGFQVFSMAHGGIADEIKGRNRIGTNKSLLGIDEQGARFRSYRDGREFYLTPEISVDIQQALGADLIMPLDECTAFHDNKDYTAKSLERTNRWELRSLEQFHRHADGKQAIYGITQGGTYLDLRAESCQFTRENAFFGTAIGGTFGKTKEQMYELFDHSSRHIHPDRPVHILGLGGIPDILECAGMGYDTFDCVAPTRIARHGWALMKGQPGSRLNLRNASCAENPDPIDETCGCSTCATYSRAYLHHLLKAGEYLSVHLIVMHNVWTMNRLMRDVRTALKTGTLPALKKEWLVD